MEGEEENISVDMTLRYAHLSPEHKRAAVEVLGKRMDTIWTPRGEKRKEEKIDIPESPPAQ